MKKLIQSWTMANGPNYFLLEKLEDEWLDDRLASRTRTVRQQFAHMHNVRLMWISHAAPELKGKAGKFPRGAKPSREELVEALKASEAVVAEFLDSCLEKGKVPGWKGPVESFMAYLVAHEGHHRGLAMAALRVCGRKPGEQIVYGQWEWGKKR